jgi:hypothetical protein
VIAGEKGAAVDAFGAIADATGVGVVEKRDDP